MKKRSISWAKIKDQKYLFFMSVPFVIWMIIFRYVPIWGWTMAFQNYKPSKSFFEQQWVGFDQFVKLFSDSDFYLSLKNTLAMSIMGLIAGFILPIVFAIMLNEVRGMAFKKTVQTVSYLPHFISWAIAAGMITQLLSVDGGAINDMLISLGIIDKPYAFMAQSDLFWWIVTIADAWKETGWNSIIYISAMAGIDASLYEAAQIDGAGRLKRILHVTLPGIRPTIAVILIMNIGWLLNIGFERQMLLGNAMVQDASLVIDYYALKYGIGLTRYSYGTAIGMFKSVVSIALVLMANKVSKKIGDGSII